VDQLAHNGCDDHEIGFAGRAEARDVRRDLRLHLRNLLIAVRDRVPNRRA
jgi:hypothetical protein